VGTRLANRSAPNLSAMTDYAHMEKNSVTNATKENESSAIEYIFTNALKEVYDEVYALSQALPAISRGVGSDDLRASIEVHLERTKLHIERLGKIFLLLYRETHQQNSAASKELPLLNGQEPGSIWMDPEEDVKPRHAEYASLIQLAGHLGLTEIARILSDALSGEKLYPDSGV